MPAAGGWPAARPAWLAWPAAAALAVLLSLGQAGREHVGTDFHAFWQAGRDFAAGLPLYAPAAGARHFKYPPFAAQALQPLGLLSLDAAAIAFHALSLLLAAGAVLLTWRVAGELAPARRPGPGPLILAAAATIHILQSDLSRNQTNLLILVLCLAGVLALARARPVRAAAWLSAATLVKLTPAVLLTWLVIRGGRRAALGVVACLAVGLAVPVVQRGLERGLDDYADFRETLLAPFARGEFTSRPANQSLAAALERAFVPGAGGGGLDHAWLPGGPAAARIVPPMAASLLVLAFLAGLVLLQRRRRPLNLFEVAAAFLLALLVSGLSWKAHFVPLLFVFYAFLSLPTAAWPRPARQAHAVLVALILLSGLGGRDIVGPALYAALFHYGFYTWLALALYGASLALAQAPPERLGGPPTRPGRS
jgi:hypothetical protein